jgi:HPt (histidine-containing phosphotransfer) domain-containing protein
MNSVSHLDREVLDTLQDVLEDDFPVLIDTFIKDSSERITCLQRALATADSDGVRRAAHSFKGSCSNLGVLRLAEMCQEVEDKGRLGELAGLECQLVDIQQEFSQVKVLLQALV